MARWRSGSVRRAGVVGAALVAGLLAAGLLTAAAGCAASERPVRPSPAARAGAVATEREILPVATRVDVITGVQSVVAVTVGPEVEPGGPVVVKLDDGRSPPALLRRVEVTPEVDLGSWAPPPGVWRVLGPAEAARDGAAVVWVLSVDLPPDGLGQGLWVNGKRWELNWLPSPRMLANQHPELAWESPVKPEARRSPTLARLMEPDRLSPARRWRYRLAMDGFKSLTGRAASIVDAASGGAAFDEPVLEAMAVEGEARWATALAQLRLSHPDVARRLAARLALVVEFTGALGRRDGTAVHAPAWVTGQESLERLVTELLDPNLSPRRRAARAEAWLADQRPALGWVVDDARATDAIAGGLLATVGIANLTEVATLGWVSVEPQAQAPSMSPVGAAAARSFTLAGERDARAGTAAEALHRLMFHAGSWKDEGAVMSARLGVTPPGLTIGPLLPDWTMADWVGASSRPMVVEAEWSTGAMLFRGPAGEGAGGSWMLYVECRRPEAGVESPQEFIRVWLGPTGRARLVVRASPEESAENSAGASVVKEPGRWAARIEIPASCIEPDGTLRVGIERGDSRGVHSAWPRRMLPWQAEPGRLAVDTTAWSGMTGGRE